MEGTAMTSKNPQHRGRAALSAALIAVVITVAWPTNLNAQAPPGPGRGGAPPAEALFTSAQAIAGKAAYDRNCASCHGAKVDDGKSAPQLRGPAFLAKYAGKPETDLFTYVSTNMPKSSP